MPQITHFACAYGSPAWAGIDPPTKSRKAGRRGFPRVGGDRPREWLLASMKTVVPPRGRG